MQKLYVNIGQNRVSILALKKPNMVINTLYSYVLIVNLVLNFVTASARRHRLLLTPQIPLNTVVKSIILHSK